MQRRRAADLGFSPTPSAQEAWQRSPATARGAVLALALPSLTTRRMSRKVGCPPGSRILAGDRELLWSVFRYRQLTGSLERESEERSGWRPHGPGFATLLRDGVQTASAM